MLQHIYFLQKNRSALGSVVIRGPPGASGASHTGADRFQGIMADFLLTPLVIVHRSSGILSGQKIFYELTGHKTVNNPQRDIYCIGKVPRRDADDAQLRPRPLPTHVLLHKRGAFPHTLFCAHNADPPSKLDAITRHCVLLGAPAPTSRF